MENCKGILANGDISVIMQSAFPRSYWPGSKNRNRRAETVILCVNFLYHGPASSHACENRSLAFFCLTSQLIPESRNDQEAAELVLYLAQTPTVGLCSALSHAVRCSQGPEVGQGPSFVSPK